MSRSRVDLPWSEKDELALIDLFNGGYSLPEICDVLERNEAGVVTRLERLGLVVSTEGQEVYKVQDCWHRKEMLMRS